MGRFQLKFILIYFVGFLSGVLYSEWNCHRSSCPSEIPIVSRWDLATEIGKLLKTHRHAFSSNIRQMIAQLMKVDRNGTEPNVIRSIDVCPEIYMGNKFGYPDYREGFQLQNCTEAPKFTHILTVLLDTVHNSDIHDLNAILSGINESYAGIRVLIATSSGNQSAVESACQPYPNCSAVIFRRHLTEGQIWSDLVRKSSTKYVFVGRKLTNFLSDSRLERLVRLLNYVGAEIVGGAIRDPQGHWDSGCFQSSMRNFAYRLTDGYDLSYNSCLFCDYLTGPFATRPQLVGELLKGAEALSGQILFADLFAKLRYGQGQNAKILSCPDSLHFTSGNLNISKVDRDDWVPFAQRWELSKIRLPSGQKFNYDCDEVNLNCKWQKGIAMPPCCLEEISSALRTLMQICEENRLGCELDAGTIIGSVKFSSILPWERDSDINFLITGRSKLLNLTNFFHSKKLQLTEPWRYGKVSDCIDLSGMHNCGKFVLNSANFFVELWGVTQLAQHYFDQRGISAPTKTLVDGVWMNTYPNPALSSRNRYGDDLFAHAEHWRTMGYSSSWDTYRTGSFLKCPTPGFHGCLDRFFGTGNIQFRDL